MPNSDGKGSCTQENPLWKSLTILLICLEGMFVSWGSHRRFSSLRLVAESTVQTEVAVFVCESYRFWESLIVRINFWKEFFLPKLQFQANPAVKTAVKTVKTGGKGLSTRGKSAYKEMKSRMKTSASNLDANEFHNQSNSAPSSPVLGGKKKILRRGSKVKFLPWNQENGPCQFRPCPPWDPPTPLPTATTRVAGAGEAAGPTTVAGTWRGRPDSRGETRTSISGKDDESKQKVNGRAKCETGRHQIFQTRAEIREVRSANAERCSKKPLCEQFALSPGEPTI